MNTILALAFVTAHAETNPSEMILSPTEEARAMSIQIRGVIPTLEELEAIESAGEIDESLLDEWLVSSEFEEQVVRHHQSIFWNSPYQNDLEVRRVLFFSNGRYYRKQTSQYVRGQSRTSCSDWENTDVDQWNRPQTVLEQSYTQNGQEFIYLDEGWVWVTPYWNPTTPIKVCAFDARTNLVSDTGVDCRTRDSNKDSGCGCGPNLEWCMTRTVQTVYKEAFAEELSVRVKRALSEDRPYTDILTEDITYMNGPLSFYYRNIDSYVGRTSAPVDNIPELDFFDTDTWVAVATPEEHSGALTSAGWLLRHQTNRGRASRFYEGFLCSTFVPPTGGIIDEGLSTPDLSLKRGCADCHARLEPWRAYWGRWGEVSSQYITEVDYPTYSENCAECAEDGGCNNFCRNNYMVDPIHADDEPYIGWYLPYVYLKQTQSAHPDTGPSAWVTNVVSDGTLAQCVTQNAVTWLYGWEADETDPELLKEWTRAFEQSGYSYPVLVKTLLIDETYGRRK